MATDDAAIEAMARAMADMAELAIGSVRQGDVYKAMATAALAAYRQHQRAAGIVDGSVTEALVEVDRLRVERDDAMAALTAEATLSGELLARLAEAVEVMRDVEAISRTSVGAGFHAIHEHARAFLAKMEGRSGE